MLDYHVDFPVPGWTRYEFMEFIGEGGMGLVYKARDPRLNRIVALKFLRYRDSEQLRRFFQEAQAQAKVDHGRVGRVYEVGEAEGHPYIAMQYIQGVSIEKAARGMAFEQKVNLMLEVSEAVHAAHRLGLIHRDLKPANILVESGDDGIPRPFVVDFGLARQLDSQEMTTSGTVLGSPCYMAPEQARGEIHRLDRRTDVYGLGATFYELLTGQPPFDGDNSMQVIFKVLEKEPQPLRKIDPAIPADIEIIVMKCLEKEPQRRYDSARALFEDVRRYRDGEPLFARRASLTYKVSKKIRKNKALAVVVAVAVLLISMVGVWAVKMRLDARERAALAQRFGQDVKEMEGVMRLAYLLPLHDVRREKRLVNERLERIRAVMKDLGSVALGPGNFALGCGHLALRDFRKARECLQSAWDNGFRGPEVAYAQGRVLGELYQEALREVGRIENEEWRRARQKQIEQEYRDPALFFLNLGKGSLLESRLLGEALIAYYEKRYPESLSKSQAASSQYPWLYECQKIEGDIAVASGSQACEKGDYPAAAKHFAQAAAAYDRAALVARSDASIYAGQGKMWQAIMELESLRGKSPLEAARNGSTACDRTLAADPESPAALICKSEICTSIGEYQNRSGEDPQASWQTSVELARKAAALAPRDPVAWNALGQAHIRLGRYAMDHGRDPRPMLTSAGDSFIRARKIDPTNGQILNNLAMANSVRGIYELGNGQDPRPAVDRALAFYRQSIASNPSVAATFINMGTANMIRLEYERKNGLDPRDSLEQAIAAYRQAIRINPRNPIALRKLGETFELKGEEEMDRGQDPRSSLKLACENLEQSLRIDPGHKSTHLIMGITLCKRGEYEISRGLDPRPSLRLAVTSYRRIIQINPQDPFAYVDLTNAYLVLAEYELEHGSNPTGSLTEALASTAQAVRINPRDHLAFNNQAWAQVLQAEFAFRRGLDPRDYLNQAERTTAIVNELNSRYTFTMQTQSRGLRLRARYSVSQGADPLPFLARAREVLQRCIAIDPNDPWTLLECIRIELQAAEWTAARQQSPQICWDRAADFLGRAQQLIPGEARNHLLLGELYWQKASWRAKRGEPCRQEMEEGLRQTAEARRINPRLAKAAAVQAVLYALQARTAPDAAARAASLNAARRSRREALAEDPQLGRDFQALLKELPAE